MHFWQERPRGHGASSAGQPGQRSHSLGTSRSPKEPRLPGGISVSVRRVHGHQLRGSTGKVVAEV